MVNGEKPKVNVSISCTIMQSSFNAQRKQSVEQLQFQLFSQEWEKNWLNLTVIKDDVGRGPWWTAKKCWEEGSVSNATHHLLLQDDVVICNNFVNGIKSVISSYSNDIISLFHGPRKAFNGSARWGLSEGVWGQGIVMPVYLVEEFLKWEAKNISKDFPHDDSRVSLFAIKTKRHVKVPFPNLVDHRDVEIKSVMGHKWIRPRISSDFMGERNPEDFDWSNKKNQMKSVNSFTQYNKYLLK